MTVQQQELLRLVMVEAIVRLRQLGKGPEVKWFSNNLGIVSAEATTVAEGASWVLRDIYGQQFGIYLEGDLEYLSAGLPTILAEDLEAYGWTDPDEEGIRWLTTPEIRDRNER